MVSQVLSHIAIYLFFVQFCYGQSNLGARLSAMAESGTAVKDVWNVNGNFAGITKIATPTLSANYTKYLYDTDLSRQGIVAVFPFTKTFFGIGFQRYGISEYNETRATLGVAKSFGEQLSIGINGSYNQIKISGYGNAKHFSFDIGFQYALTDEIILGGYLANPVRIKSSYISLWRPRTYQFGLGYQANDKLLLTTSFKKESDHPVDILTGLEYRILEFLFIRGGISVKPFKQYLGIGFQANKLNIDVSLDSYPNIGMVPQIALAYAF